MPSAFQTQYRASRSNLQRHMNSALIGTFRHIQALNGSIALQHAKYQALPTSVLFRIYAVDYRFKLGTSRKEKHSLNEPASDYSKSLVDFLQSGTLLSKMPGGDKIRPCTVALVFALGAQWAVKALQVVRISWPHLLSSFHILSYLSYLTFWWCSILIFILPLVSLLKFSPNCFVLFHFALLCDIFEASTVPRPDLQIAPQSDFFLQVKLGFQLAFGRRPPLHQPQRESKRWLVLCSSR